MCLHITFGLLNKYVSNLYWILGMSVVVMHIILYLLTVSYLILYGNREDHVMNYNALCVPVVLVKELLIVGTDVYIQYTVETCSDLLVEHHLSCLV